GEQHEAAHDQVPIPNLLKPLLLDGYGVRYLVGVLNRICYRNGLDFSARRIKLECRAKAHGTTREGNG
ncbi:MAG: hypothetical protein AB2559_15520, partial [Candidatus Thiodiazotropha endolucinida]